MHDYGNMGVENEHANIKPHRSWRELVELVLFCLIAFVLAVIF